MRPTSQIHTVIHQCALKRDLELFDAGDKTEIGERGLTLRLVELNPFMYR